MHMSRHTTPPLLRPLGGRCLELSEYRAHNKAKVMSLKGSLLRDRRMRKKKNTIRIKYQQK